MSNIAIEQTPNVRSSGYTIVESRTLCGHCKRPTAVFAFALPKDYESLVVYDETPEDEPGTWESPKVPAILSYVEHLPETVAANIRGKTSHYRLDLHDESGQNLWINHCEHCGGQMEEEELHGDLDGPFGSMASEEGLVAIKLFEVQEPFQASAGGETHSLKHMDG
jgi:hypothetical protein